VDGDGTARRMGGWGGEGGFRGDGGGMIHFYGLRVIMSQEGSLGEGARRSRSHSLPSPTGN